ncbi:unnamed protein product [Meloidogyne enterolobii]|uniref:Uncharacterized protein n=1 Tax=Meloidogyne enterolobii TaxID=390850 RepID=A0ACB0XM12_MELEN
MMTGCDNPILYSEIYKLLPKNIQNKLEERMFEENIGMALLVNLERCFYFIKLICADTFPCRLL